MKCKNLFQILLTLLLLSSCKIVPWDDFTYYQKYKGNADIRMDGYYYYIDTNEHEPVIDNVLIFYNNGLWLSLAGFDNHKSIGDFIINHQFDTTLTYRGSRWGAFVVEDDALKIQRFKPLGVDWFVDQFRLYEGRFHIKNDTTLILRKGYLIHERKPIDLNWKYHFKKFNHKPDSTNNWIVNSDKLNR